MIVLWNQKREVYGQNIFIQFQDSSIKEIVIDKDPIIYSKADATLNDMNQSESYIDVITGQSMVINYDNNDLERVEVMGMASSLYHVTDNFLLEGINEVSGDSIFFSFEDEQLTRIKVNGGGVGLYTPEIGSSSIDSIIYYFQCSKGIALHDMSILDKYVSIITCNYLEWALINSHIQIFLWAFP